MSNDMDDGSSEDYYNHYFGQTEKNNYAQEVGQFLGQTEQVGQIWPNQTNSVNFY